jgi:anti-sigma B factor antagonist
MGLEYVGVGAGDQLRIEVRHETDRVILGLAGELDIASAPRLQEAIESVGVDPSATVVLDLQQLRFIDSTGLRVILSARARSQEHGKELAVTPGSQQVQRLLSVTGVSEHLRIIAASDEMLV